MLPSITHWNPALDGPFSEAALRQKMKRLGYHATSYVYPPGTFFPDHRHSRDKLDAVVSGRFRMIVEGQEFLLQAGDMLAVPHGVVHSAEVVGEEQVVSLDGVTSI